CCYILPPDLGVPAQEDVSYFDIPMPPPGKIDWQLFAGNVIQDVAIVASQGTIYDCSRERLRDSDQGINIYRKMLAREIRKMEHGEDPKNVFRDPEETRCPVLPFGKSRGRARAAIFTLRPREQCSDVQPAYQLPAQTGR